MYILGIIYSLNSTVCLFRDGEIVSAVSEEKFTRIKNDDAFPVQALNWTLTNAGLSIEQVDWIALSTQSYQGHDDYQLLRKFSSFKIDDYVREQTHFWRPKILEKKDPQYLDVFKDKICTDQYDPPFWKNYAQNGRNGDYRITLLNHFFGQKTPPIVLIDHHRAHASYAYYGSPFREKKCLVVTADAFGDGLNATISIVENGRLKRVFETNKFATARLYKFMTLLLGMKPNEHEFKVMGLAPYAKEPILAKPYMIFRNTLCVDGLDFSYQEKPTDYYFYFKDKLEGCRFDGIAAGLQRYVEELLVEWVRNMTKKFDIHRLVFSGGIAMNVKAMGKIAQMPEVDEFFVCGCGSDESTALGACYALYEDHVFSQKKTPDREIKPLKNLYQGPDIPELNRKRVEAILAASKGEYEIVENPSASDVVDFLIKGKVIARCVGKTEFGARALGNRSIMADPRNPAIVPIINGKIKNRDFWMPFAPIIMDTFVDKYLVNHKSLSVPYMTVGFDTTPLAQNHLPAALHAADKSARPQILRRIDNPPLYELLETFQKKTGVGGLINTSFNLHGHPIVCAPQDAMFVMDNSELDALLLPGFFIVRK